MQVKDLVYELTHCKKCKLDSRKISCELISYYQAPIKGTIEIKGNILLMLFSKDLFSIDLIKNKFINFSSLPSASKIILKSECKDCESTAECSGIYVDDDNKNNINPWIVIEEYFYEFNKRNFMLVKDFYEDEESFFGRFYTAEEVNGEPSYLKFSNMINIPTAKMFWSDTQKMFNTLSMYSLLQ